LFVLVLRSLPMESVSYLVLWRGANPLGSSSSKMSSFSTVFKNPFKGLGPCEVMLMIQLLQIDSDRASFSSQRRGSPWMQNPLSKGPGLMAEQTREGPSFAKF